MTWLRTALSRIAALFRRKRLDRDLDDEIKSHLEMLAEEKQRRGMSAEEARNAALREFGGVAQMQESYREARGLRFLSTLAQDARYSLRLLRRSPGFAITAVLLLALGIGANTAIFSGIDAVMLRLLPVKNPHQLITLEWSSQEFPQPFLQDQEGGGRRDPATGRQIYYSFSYSTYQQIRSHNRTLATSFAFAGDDQVNIGVNGHAEDARVQPVSGDFFESLGVQARLGRMIVPSDDQESAQPVAVVSEGYWREKLGEDRDIAGKTIIMNGSPVNIVGVAPQWFFGLEPGHAPDMWIPLSLHSWQWTQLGYDNNGPLTKDPKTWWLQIAGRLRPGVTLTEAQAELSQMFAQSIDLYGNPSVPEAQRPSFSLFPLDQGLTDVRDGAATPLFLLMGMAGLVLLIACANVAGLLLTRASARQRELAIRLSLGAGRWRIIRQLMTESVLLAGLGGTLGLLLAVWLSSVLATLMSGGKPITGLEFHFDASILLFTAAASLLSGMIFGLVPALRATRLDLLSSLKQSATASGARRLFALGNLLAAAQVALCLLLLTCAGLFLRTLKKLNTVDLGFDRHNFLLFDIRPGLNGYKDARLADFYPELQRRIQSVPGVTSVSFAQRGPIGQGGHTTLGTIPGFTRTGERVKLNVHTVGAGYFDMLGIPVLLGRSIGPQDDSSARHVIVVNQKLVHDYFHGENPLGHHIEFGTPKQPNAYEIVGVTSDVKYEQIRSDVPPTIYFSYRQRHSLLNFMTFQVRFHGDQTTVAAAVRRQAQALDPDVPVVNIRSQSEVIDGMLTLEHAFAALSTAFGGLALLLACVGLYGTMAYAVARRTGEIGIRIALGARRQSILAMVLKETLAVGLSGLIVGLPLAWLATIALRSQLFGLSAHDPATLISAGTTVVLVTALAGYLPARRASRVDPMVALRYE